MADLPDIYFLPEWGEYYQEHDNGKIQKFEYKSKLGHVYYQFIIRNDHNVLESTKYYDLVTTYGFNGPIILECDINNKLKLIKDYDKEFNIYCLDNNIVTEWIRFSPWLKNHIDFESIYINKYNNFTVFIDLEVNDFFFEEFHPRARTSIRKSIQYGVKIEFDFIGETVGEFHRLYQFVDKKYHVSDYYIFDLEFLKKGFISLSGKEFIINAIYEDQIISSAIILNYGDYIHYHLAAHNPEFYYLNASSLMFYHLCLWGKTNNKKQFHLGGAFTEGLFDFKKQFTRNGFCDFYVGKKIRNEEVYNIIVNKKLQEGSIKDMSYFPLYRG